MVLNTLLVYQVLVEQAEAVQDLMKELHLSAVQQIQAVAEAVQVHHQRLQQFKVVTVDPV